MCGIFAYVGAKKRAPPIILDGLSCLEYRGYDSAGIYCAGSGAIKSVGGVGNLRRKIPADMGGMSGIGHLRWATHGEPTEANAHPHHDCSKNIWVVHNGIIENHRELKEQLLESGHTFYSETDTEVLAHLVEEELRQGKNFKESVISALNKIQGTYGAVFSCQKEPEKIIAARMGAPVVIGLGDGENFVASDPSPILRHTKNVIYLKDGDVAILKADSYDIYALDHSPIDRPAETVEWNPGQIEKGSYEHFMLKEIMEGPDVVRNTLRGRLIPDEGRAKLGGL
jgi:glucosamine--fructose-6-phosphate aminotransferase (isomerizing)